MSRLTGKPFLPRKTGILAIGLDCDDGHTRITWGDNFALFGGSEATHEFRAQTAQGLAGRVDEIPVALDGLGLRADGLVLHDDSVANAERKKRNDSRWPDPVQA